MERCSKCSGVMLQMKTKKSLVSDAEKKQVFRCSRCGLYLEKQQAFTSADYDRDGHSGNPYPPYRSDGQ